jgi:hypothetical protein
VRAVGVVVAAVVGLTACNPSGNVAESRGMEAIYGGDGVKATCSESAGGDPAGPVVWQSKGSCKVRFADGSTQSVNYSSEYSANDRNLDVVVRSGNWRCYGNGAGSNWSFYRCAVA